MNIRFWLKERLDRLSSAPDGGVTVLDHSLFAAAVRALEAGIRVLSESE